MSALFDFQAIEEGILAAGELAECKGLTAARNTFDAGERNGLFADDVPGGATLSGGASLVVQGALNGQPGNPCRIQVEGDLLVAGDASHAQIRCRNLYLAGHCRHSRLVASGDMTIGGDVGDAHLLGGDIGGRRQHMEDLQRQRSQGNDEYNNLERQIHQSEKRIDRSCKATRIPLDFNLSRIITHREKQVRIDLSKFYASFAEMPEETRKSALMEFFAKGIVGYLARANRKYIDDNPAREKVFLQLLKHLRELFMLVAERDFLAMRQQRLQEQIDACAADLGTVSAAIHVQGRIRPESAIRFALAHVRRLDSGEYSVEEKFATLKVLAADPGALRLEREDALGAVSVQELPELEGITLQAPEGQIVWNAVAAESPG